MIPKPAQYLLRFDDLCPTTPQARWQEFLAVIAKFNIRPILAVVPDNQDATLETEPPDPGFWEKMRALEAAGATIAVHGYQHLCQSRGPSLLGIHRRSEFAGVDFKTQREWVRSGIAILRQKGLSPRLWVAPRHGFDRNTLRALREEGIEYISDGFARVPFRRDGVTWIPQQLWLPIAKPKGLWTICFHPWAARRSDVEELRTFLEDFGQQFTSFARVIQEFESKPLALSERLYQWLALSRIHKRNERARRRRHKRDRQLSMHP